MSLERAVVRLILKKTSLLLSVTLILRCSVLVGGCSSEFTPAPGDCSRSDMILDGRFNNQREWTGALPMSTMRVLLPSLKASDKLVSL